MQVYHLDGMETMHNICLTKNTAVYRMTISSLFPFVLFRVNVPQVVSLIHITFALVFRFFNDTGASRSICEVILGPILPTWFNFNPSMDK